jgi:cation diffusion facilitator CzcD-associated flavoprotein CzcO
MRMTSSNDRRIAIIGTGFSGLCLGYHLKKRGHESFTLFEKAGRIGGTWRENTYPGAECDIPSALYSFSFERNPNWTHKWSEQPEILAYMDHCCDKFGLRPHIRFNTEVTEATFDEGAGVWNVTTADGAAESFDIVISAVGQLHKPFTPEVEGAEAFQGRMFHSAKWDHDYDLTGKTVSVVGNAASALQFIPEIAPQVAKLNVFQRSANWVVPKQDREYSAFEKWLGTVLPVTTKFYRFLIWLRGEGLLYPLMRQDASEKFRERAQQATIDYIDEHIKDPELREKLIPDYPIGAKRILFSDNYYEALARENVDVITDPIARITGAGIETNNGAAYPSDAIIFSTGFVSTDFLTPMRVQGRDGQVLNDVWQASGAEAYLGITHAGFPNFFMMYGPNTNLGHNSIILMIEAQTRYVMSCLDALDARDAKWLDLKADAQKAYNDWIAERMQEMIWTAVPDSWYLRNGKVTNNWVGRTTEYIKRTKRVDPENYEFAS